MLHYIVFIHARQYRHIRFTQIFTVLITVYGHRKKTSNIFPKYTINTKNDGKK